VTKQVKSYDAKKEQHDQKKAAYEAKNAEKRQAKLVVPIMSFNLIF
jgi:hypothetical protein